MEVQQSRADLLIFQGDQNLFQTQKETGLCTMLTPIAILLYKLQYYCQFHILLLYKELLQEEISGGCPRYKQLHFQSCYRKTNKQTKIQNANNKISHLIFIQNRNSSFERFN